MPYLDEATLKANHPIFDSFAFWQTGNNYNLHAGRKVTVALHGTGGNNTVVGDWCADAVNYSTDNSQVVIAPKATGGDGWWQAAKSFNGISATDSEFTAAVAAGVALVDAVVACGVPLEQIALVGHSQGGCLAIEIMLAKLVALGPNASTLPDRFAMVMPLASGCVGMFQDDQADCETHAFWTNKVYGQPVHLAAKEFDPTVPEVISRYTAEVLENHCAALVSYRVETGATSHSIAPPNTDFDDEKLTLRAAMA